MVALAAQQGFCGIKVHAHDARVTREVAEAARHWGLPVLYDPAGDTATVGDGRPRLSRRRLGGAPPVLLRRRLEGAVRLRRPAGPAPDLYTDTSGVRYYDLLEDAVRRAGPHKVLFGTDGPFLHPAVELAKVRALPRPPTGVGLVLGGNVLRLTAPRAPTTRRCRHQARSSEMTVFWSDPTA